MESVPAGFKEIAPYLMHPLVLVGFVALLFFGIHRALIKSGIIPPLSERSGSTVVKLLLRYGFQLALVVIVLGFGLRYFEMRAEAGAGASGVSSKGDVSVTAGGGGTAVLQTGSGTITKGVVPTERQAPAPPPSLPAMNAARPSGGSITASGNVSVEAKEGSTATLQTGSGRIHIQEEKSQ
jgi:hypothetical protein